MQAAEMRFSWRGHGITQRGKLRRCEMCKTLTSFAALNVEPVLLRMENAQLRWVGYETRMPQETSVGQALLATSTGKRPSKNPVTDHVGWLYLRPGLVISWYGASGTMNEQMSVWHTKPTRLAQNSSMISRNSVRCWQPGIQLTRQSESTDLEGKWSDT